MFGRERVEKRSGKSGFTVSLVTASATFGLFLLVALISVWVVYFGPGPSARQGDRTVVTLASGSGVSAIGAQLKAAGVIRSVDLFRAAASGLAAAPHVGAQAGAQGQFPGRPLRWN